LRGGAILYDTAARWVSVFGGTPKRQSDCAIVQVPCFRGRSWNILLIPTSEQTWLSPEIDMATGERYVVDEAGRRTAVLVPLHEWERIQAALEELADVRAYDEAKRHPSDQVSFEQAMAEIEADAET
jgi:hypothetical protein